MRQFSSHGLQNSKGQMLREKARIILEGNETLIGTIVSTFVEPEYIPHKLVLTHLECSFLSSLLR